MEAANKIYSVFIRMRSRKLEKLLVKEESDLADSINIEFQSHSLNSAKKYFDSIEPVNNQYWIFISKSLIATHLDISSANGFYNKEALYDITYYPKFKETDNMLSSVTSKFKKLGM